MESLPHSLYRAEQVRELDRVAIDDYGLTGATLMERAARYAFRSMVERWPGLRRVAILCGAGNNGGDGYGIARLAQEAGLSARVLQLAPEDKLSGDALAMARAARAAGVVCEPWSGQSLSGFDAVVDAMLGTGLAGEVRPPYATAIAAVNASGAPVMAVDVPSGLDADSGRILGDAVRADITPTFIGLKQGLFTGAGPECSGEVLFDDLGVPDTIHTLFAPNATRLDRATVDTLLNRRPRSAHKGDFGHVLVVGGDSGMLGAVRMTAEAAARTGAGLTGVATRPAHAPLISAVRPELMCHGVEQGAELAPLLQRATVLAVGPGLGRGEWGRSLLEAVAGSDLPMVVDADGLNLIAASPCERGNWILTPHPGEAARLLGISVAEIQADRFAAARAVQNRYGGVCVLKGAGTLVVDGSGAIAICTAGNPGMASGGMGDLLTGVIAALLAQGFELSDAARLGVCLHAAAGDLAAQDGERGMLATDLLPHLRRLANPAQ